MEMGVLWDMKVGAQCGRQLCPHPQDREERDSGVPENSICWCHTPAGEQWTGGQAGSEAVPWPGQQGVTPGNPQPSSPSLHTTRHWMFPTLANTRVPVHMDITVTQHFIICITIAPAFQDDFGSPSFFTRGS